MLQHITQTEMVVYLAIVTGFLAGGVVVGWQLARINQRLNEVGQPRDPKGRFKKKGGEA